MAKKPKYYVRPDGLHEAIRVINGKRVAFRGRTDTEVEKKMREYKEVEERGPLFKDVAEKWREMHWPTLSPATLKSYEANYRRAIERFGDMPLLELTPMDIDAMLQQMSRQQYSRKTVSAQRLIINMVCRSAVLEGVSHTIQSLYSRHGSKRIKPFTKRHPIRRGIRNC